MAGLKVILYKGKILNNNEYPLIIEVYKDTVTKRIALGYSLKLECWNKKKKQVLSNYKNYKSLNSLIKQKLGEAEKQKIQLESEKESYTLDELVDRIRKNKPIKDFNSYSKELIEDMKKAKRYGNAEVYQYTLNFVEKVSGKKYIPFYDIDYKFLIKLETAHLSKEGNTLNGLSLYMRTIRAIYNKAIKSKIVDKKYYPFADYSIKETKTKKRAISKEDIIKIRNIALIEGTTPWHAKNYFLFSFYTIGMSWTDLASLKVQDIKNDRIVYIREKTGKEYSIKINDNIAGILKHYLPGKNSEEYVFPIISRTEDPIETRKDIKNGLHNFNKKMNAIAKKLEIQTNLTSYVSRHSWGSIANFSNVPLGIIQEGYGHADLKTTQIYLADFESADIDEANQRISNLEKEK